MVSSMPKKDKSYKLKNGAPGQGAVSWNRKGGHSGYHDKNGNLLVNPKGSNPGDVISTKEVVLTDRERSLMKFFNQRGSGGNPGHGIQGSTLGSTYPKGKNPGDCWEFPMEISFKPLKTNGQKHRQSSLDSFGEI